MYIKMKKAEGNVYAEDNRKRDKIITSINIGLSKISKIINNSY